MNTSGGAALEDLAGTAENHKNAARREARPTGLRSIVEGEDGSPEARRFLKCGDFCGLDCSSEYCRIYAVCHSDRENERKSDHMFIALSPLVSLVAGILILIFPCLLNFIVAIHLIIVGALGLIHR